MSFSSLFGGITRHSLVHSARTAIAAVASLLLASCVGLPQPYWAVIGTMIVTQSSLGSALAISGQRIAATILGAFLGALLADSLGSNIAAFTIGIFALGLVCSTLRLDKPAYRFSGITLAIVMYAANNGSHWWIAIHRSLEISAGIVCGLVMAILWPEPLSETEEKTPRA